MAISKDDIVRSDFPTARKGYDPNAVDAHLREVAERVSLAEVPAALTRLGLTALS